MCDLVNTEAEYMSLTAATPEAVWIRQLLSDLMLNLSMPTWIYEYNKSAICMTKNPQHIGIKHHFVYEQVKKEM